MDGDGLNEASEGLTAEGGAPWVEGEGFEAVEPVGIGAASVWLIGEWLSTKSMTSALACLKVAVITWPGPAGMAGHGFRSTTNAGPTAPNSCKSISTVAPTNSNPEASANKPAPSRFGLVI